MGVEFEKKKLEIEGVVNLKFNYEFILLDEWYIKHRLNKNFELGSIAMQVFCSFLDRKSLEFAFKLIQSDFLDKFLFKYDEIEKPSILFIFFPVSPSNFINSAFKSKIEQICRSELNLQKFHIEEILENAQNIIEKRYNIYRSYRIQDFEYNVLPKLENHQKNRFLFGELAAKYLEYIKFFPLILVKDRMYEGIPLNFSMNSFINDIIFKELNSIKPDEKILFSAS